MVSDTIRWGVPVPTTVLRGKIHREEVWKIVESIFRFSNVEIMDNNLPYGGERAVVRVPQYRQRQVLRRTVRRR